MIFNETRANHHVHIFLLKDLKHLSDKFRIMLAISIHLNSILIAIFNCILITSLDSTTNS
mgnify:CR=1 FL=1